MYYKLLVLWLCISPCNQLFGQETFKVKGKVVDSMTSEPIEGAYISGENILTFSDHEGRFIIQSKAAGILEVWVTHIGYAPKVVTVSMTSGIKEVRVKLTESITSLTEVRIQGKTKQREAREEALVSLLVTEEHLDNNRENSLMQTLKKIPGVGAINIGSGQSKPTIRGLGFNRVIVVQDGIKHEAQQWGTDHGLEIDQYGIENIRIIKGPASLIYGSDAIAGTIVIQPSPIPLPDTFEGDANILGETNNNLLGISTAIKARKDQWYYGGRITYRDYTDYKVPTNKITYENYIFDLHENHLRNTAGREFNTKLDLGFVSDHVRSKFTLSNVWGKNGFFANAHGLEVRTSKIDYDRSNRDIDLPYHRVNHFKIIHNTTVMRGIHNFHFDWGFQNNQREEHTEPTGHGYMPKPEDTGERLFNKNTYALNARDEIALNVRHSVTAGLSLEFQDNHIGGWGFLIPAYHRFTSGIFMTDHVAVHPDLHLHAGLRYDYGFINTRSHFDWFETPLDQVDGTTSYEYVQRAQNQTLDFNNLSASAGLSYIRNHTTYKINLGKSFRMPLANELSSDGVNYHMYRYEKGNPELDAENSYQIDIELDHSTKQWSLGVSPFINLFENYIYLNPSSGFYETLQKYEYSQSKVLRAGGEIQASLTLFEKLNLVATGEYVWSRHRSGVKKGFTLPFSPPFSALFSANYRFKKLLFLNKPQLMLDYRETAPQNRIVPPEVRTEGYRVFHIAFMGEVPFSNNSPPVKIRIKLNNVFNTRYYDHSSFYRLIDVPEPGRNASLSITIPFNY